MTLAKLFSSGDEQVVLLPREFRLSGSAVEVSRRGDEIVLRAVPHPDVVRAVEALQELASLIELPEDYPPEPVQAL